MIYRYLILIFIILKVFVKGSLLFALEVKRDSTDKPAKKYTHTISKKPVEIERAKPYYPQNVIKAGIEGSVILKALIDTNGTIERVELIKSVYKDLDWEAIRAAKKFKFEPAEKGNQKVKVWVSIPFNFKLRGSKNFKHPNFDKASEYHQKARSYRFEGDYEKAIEFDQKAIEIYPEYDDAYCGLGSTYHDMEKDVDAANSYIKAVQVNPRYIDAYNRLAKIYIANKVYDEAVFIYQRIIMIYYEQAGAHENLGYVYMLMRRYKDAIKAYKKALKISVNYLSAHGGLIASYELLGKNKEAQKSYKKALEHSSRIYEYVADSYLKIEHYDKAIEIYQRAIEYEPKKFKSYLNWGWAHYKIGDFLKCIEYSEKAVELDSINLAARFNIALSYLRIGEVEKAKLLYKENKQFCESQKFDIPKGAINDLKYLIKHNIMVSEVSKILRDIFGLTYKM